MEKYLFIESCDHFESNDVVKNYDLACKLKKSLNDVKLFFIQNAVFSLRKNIEKNKHISKIILLDIPIFVDEFSLKERGILKNNIRHEIVVSSLDIIIEHMAKRVKVIWH